MSDRIGFGVRCVASVVDLFMMVLLSVAGGLFFGSLAGGSTMVARATESLEVPIGIALVIGAILGGFMVSAFLYSLIEGMTGSSVGKWLMNIQVRAEDGRTASLETLMTRWVIKTGISPLGFVALVVGSDWLSTLNSWTGFIAFVGCFMALGAPRQALHDRLAKTAVFRKPE